MGSTREAKESIQPSDNKAAVKKDRSQVKIQKKREIHDEETIETGGTGCPSFGRQIKLGCVHENSGDLQRGHLQFGVAGFR